MVRNLDEAAARRYGGHLFVLGHQKIPYYTPVVRDHTALLAAVKKAPLDATLIVRRTNYFESGRVFFNGTFARQKVVTGVDWSVEQAVFANLDFVAGDVHDMGGSDGIIISVVTARDLQVHVGDDVILEADTVTGQRNTAGWS